jgi:diguanylate cyclase (GGDEF)-like protein
MRELQRRVVRRGGTAAFLDITGFKAFNDHYGVSLGDLVIRRLGEILSEEVRPDFIGHVGGDDFVCAGDNGVFRTRVEGARLRFRALAPGFYKDRDREAGGIEAFDRYGGYRFFPFLD